MTTLSKNSNEKNENLYSGVRPFWVTQVVVYMLVLTDGDMFERTTAGTSAFNNTVWHVRESGVFVQASVVCVLCSIEVNGSFTHNICASVNR